MCSLNSIQVYFGGAAHVAPCFAIAAIIKNIVNRTGKPVNLLVFSGIFCKIRFRKLNRGKHEEAFSYLREIRVERCLLSVVIFTIAEWYESDGTGMEGVFLCRDICFLNREINHDD